MAVSNARTSSALVLLAIGVTLLAVPVSGEPSSEFKLVVHASNDLEELPAKKVSRIFLGKLTRWENGNKIVPVEPLMTSTARVAFSKIIHGRGVEAVRSYWLNEIYSGRRAAPPQERHTDTEILAVVRADPNAIGYVSAQTPLGRGLRAIRILE